jgi:hypothetical protein
MSAAASAADQQQQQEQQLFEHVCAELTAASVQPAWALDQRHLHDICAKAAADARAVDAAAAAAAATAGVAVDHMEVAAAAAASASAVICDLTAAAGSTFAAAQQYGSAANAGYLSGSKRRCSDIDEPKLQLLPAPQLQQLLQQRQATGQMQALHQQQQQQTYHAGDSMASYQLIVQPACRTQAAA